MPSEFEKFIAKSLARSGRGWKPRAREYRAKLTGWCNRLLATVSARRRGSGPVPTLRHTQEPEARATLHTLAARVRQLELAMEAMGSGRAASLGLPFTERAQALKMIREGRPARQIAAALGIPQGEVLLLTRVQELQNGLQLVGGMGKTA